MTCVAATPVTWQIALQFPASKSRRLSLVLDVTSSLKDERFVRISLLWKDIRLWHVPVIASIGSHSCVLGII
jgi:hypothetical protein